MGVGRQEDREAGSIDNGHGEAKGRGERNVRGLVCVTGGTGYIASNLICRLLQLGYAVRATVRNPLYVAGAAGDHTSNLICSLLRLVYVIQAASFHEDKRKVAFLWKLEGANERLSIVGADLMKEGSFDEALEGVEGVFHSAGPIIPEDPKDPQATMIDPTVNGVLNVLRACTKSSTVRRITMTSSCAAVRYDYNQTHNISFNESSWSNLDYCRDHQLWYALAKTKAEQEAWKFSKEHNLNLVVVNPSYVIGPFLGDFPTSTVSHLYYLLHGKIEEYPNEIIGLVHIDDVVETHILVYETVEATGRYICSSVVLHTREMMEMIRSKYSAVKLTMRYKQDSEEGHHTFSTRKVQQLGLKSFKSAEIMFDDCLQDFMRKGLLPQVSSSSSQI